MFDITVFQCVQVGSILSSFAESTIPGKVIVLILMGSSVWVWAMMLSKGQALSTAMKHNKVFRHHYENESHPLHLFLKQRNFGEAPLDVVYQHGCKAFGAEVEGEAVRDNELFLSDNKILERELTPLQLEAIRNACERTVADQALELESSMGMLATAVSAAPFLGLLGTVWGVMDAFSGMGSGNSTLSAVAPGISGALLTTIVGLLVALPSSIGYNVLTNKIRHLAVSMDNFAQEFSADMARAHVRD